MADKNNDTTQAEDAKVEETQPAGKTPAGPMDAAASSGTTAAPEEIASGQVETPGADVVEPSPIVSTNDAGEVSYQSTDINNNPIDPNAEPPAPEVHAANPAQPQEWSEDDQKIIDENNKARDEQRQWAEDHRDDDPNNATETEGEYNARITAAKAHFHSV